MKQLFVRDELRYTALTFIEKKKPLISKFFKKCIKKKK